MPSIIDAIKMRDLHIDVAMSVGRGSEELWPSYIYAYPIASALGMRRISHPDFCADL